MAPGLAVHVYDAYVDGEGILEPAILGLFTLLNLRDRGEVARGERMRFVGGPKEDRTPDLCIANAALSQLSYRPVKLQSCLKTRLLCIALMAPWLVSGTGSVWNFGLHQLGQQLE